MEIRGKTPFYPVRLSKLKSKEFITQPMTGLKADEPIGRVGYIQNLVHDSV